MKKNGFVFIESVTVILVVVLSLTLLISSYALVTRKSKENEYYDLPSDKYLLYVIGNLGQNNEEYTNTNNGTFKADKNTCSTYMNKRITDCKSVFENNNMIYYMVIKNLNEQLKRDKNPTEIYDSGTIEYLKTLKKCTNSEDVSCKDNYVVGVFYRNNKYYYVSLEL